MLPLTETIRVALARYSRGDPHQAICVRHSDGQGNKPPRHTYLLTVMLRLFRKFKGTPLLRRRGLALT